MMVESMPARQLKHELEKLKIDYSDCVEKADLVRKLKKGLLAKREEQVLNSKAAANFAFGRRSYAVAIRHYNDALAACQVEDDDVESNIIRSAEPQILCNKSISFLRMNQAILALESAQKSISKFPEFVKGYLRAAAAQSALGKQSAALLLLDTGISILQRDHNLEEEISFDQPDSDPNAKKAYEDMMALRRGVLELIGKQGDAETSLEGPRFLNEEIQNPAVTNSILLQLSEDILTDVLGNYLEAWDLNLLSCASRR
ncbi:hypothetical protein GUITHDRAFT_147486, partial [Guillardia theta CCMP2712]